ncbi:hypothetical protein GGI25_003391 [Coemansia spiralis]|uniref:Alpha/beta hydrolase fold-3 domain-containing protein n=2 Tax=Coemansia TaxID=4863 RepID=A0A9W8G7A5_9FUNG|nr:Alpha/Beta hydrolase protein [Coemansia spiralis]KAJ1990930.1 hypothetical protein EDC05_003780 [Coemansia umbellata]KAJ2621709.1 hypothetical protein GGI26_003917 [Coemansia sp. RSA 1358]KAJ2676856.1 hypothetical protein GGI25_003391 [Coemansia spiralis]
MLESLSKIALAAGFVGAVAKSALGYYINGPKCDKWTFSFQVFRDGVAHVIKASSYSPITDDQIDQLDLAKIAADNKKYDLPETKAPRKLAQVKQSAIKVSQVVIDEELFAGTGPAEAELRKLTAEDRTDTGATRIIPYEITALRPMINAAPTQTEKQTLFACVPLNPSERIILFLHGGGYKSGTPATHRGLTSRIAAQAGLRCISIDYRLAPLHPYPAQLHDAYISFCYLVQQGFRPENIIIAGDSAGGNLTLILTLLLRHTGAPPVCGLVLLCPWADLVVRRPSVSYNTDYDLLFAHPLSSPLDHTRMYYAPGHRLSPEMLKELVHPLVSPINADFSNFPPTLIHAGDKEVLLDEISQLYKNILSANPSTTHSRYTYECYPGMIHVFHQFFSLSESKSAIAAIGKFIKGL